MNSNTYIKDCEKQTRLNIKKKINNIITLRKIQKEQIHSNLCFKIERIILIGKATEKGSYPLNLFYKENIKLGEYLNSFLKNEKK